MIISEAGNQVLMFDEIQVVTGWERYVRQKLDESFKDFVTGSNASLLSKELGTSLTGRHLTIELFLSHMTNFVVLKILIITKILLKSICV